MSTTDSDSGVVTLPGRHSVEQTVAKIEQILRERGVKLFALIDHSAEAQQAGLSQRPTKLLIFGNPKAGTPVMVATPTSAIDLPLKIVVWQGEDGQTQISYNSTSYLQARHGLPPQVAQNIATVESLAALAAE